MKIILLIITFNLLAVPLQATQLVATTFHKITVNPHISKKEVNKQFKKKIKKISPQHRGFNILIYSLLGLFLSGIGLLGLLLGLIFTWGVTTLAIFGVLFGLGIIILLSAIFS